MEKINRFKCKECGKILEFPDDGKTPRIVFIIKAHMLGWTFDMHRVSSMTDADYCPEHMPEKYRPIEDQHPVATEWSGMGHIGENIVFASERYDPFMDQILYQMCESCEHRKLGYEDDGSSWEMCCAGEERYYFGHNLYEGHFYGGPARGRLCHYFKRGDFNPSGRDPLIEKEKDMFVRPYNKEYDFD